MSQRRRSRFTYAFADGIEEPRCILSYSEADVRYYFARKNQPLAYVTKGDHREAALARKERIKAKREAIKARGGFKLNQRAVNEATQMLGLKLPVKIRFHSRVGNTGGNYKHGGTFHDIMLKSYETPEQASETLWHELRHAWQAEQQGSKEAWNKYSRTQRIYSYRIRPIEIDARQFAAKMAPHYPLATS